MYIYYIYVYIILQVYFISIVRKSAQYYYRAFISINGIGKNFEYIMPSHPVS